MRSCTWCNGVTVPYKFSLLTAWNEAVSEAVPPWENWLQLTEVGKITHQVSKGGRDGATAGRLASCNPDFRR